MAETNGDFNLNKPQMSKSSPGVVSSNKQKRTSRFAIVSLFCIVLAIGCAIIDILVGRYGFLPVSDADVFITLAWGFFPAAFVLGIIGCIAIAKSKHLKGYSYTIAPVIFGGAFIITIMFMSLHAQYRDWWESANTGKYNLKQLGKAMIAYAEHNDGYLPSASRWCDLLIEHDENLSLESFKHPRIQHGACNFAFNRNLDGLRLADIPNDVVLIFEADGDWNLTGDAELLGTRRTEHGYVNVLFVDQTVWDYWFYEDGVRSKTSYEHKPLRWKP